MNAIEIRVTHDTPRWNTEHSRRCGGEAIVLAFWVFVRVLPMSRTASRAEWQTTTLSVNVATSWRLKVDKGVDAVEAGGVAGYQLRLKEASGGRLPQCAGRRCRSRHSCRAPPAEDPKPHMCRLPSA